MENSDSKQPQKQQQKGKQQPQQVESEKPQIPPISKKDQSTADQTPSPAAPQSPIASGGPSPNIEKSKQPPLNPEEEGVSLTTHIKQIVVEEEHQAALEEQIQQKLCNSESRMNKCTYKEGYKYQQVYSCRTCYEDAVKEKLDNWLKQQELNKDATKDDKLISGQQQTRDQLTDDQQKILDEYKELDADARSKFIMELDNKDIRDQFEIREHGFCLGCMITCHEGHECNELYSRMDFRCDCGNSRMFQSCSLQNEKEYDNTQNHYTHNFYDLYCHCKQPHDQESIEQKKVFMIQCFNCEDWFHNVHLDPVPKAPEIDEQYFLICGNCTKSYGGDLADVMIKYREYLYPDIKEVMLEQQTRIDGKNNKGAGSEQQEGESHPGEEQADEPPIEKRQKIDHVAVVHSEPQKENASGDFRGIILDNKAKEQQFSSLKEWVIGKDIIIDDKFLTLVKGEDNSKELEVLKKIMRMVDAMENLDQEDVEIYKNLDGEVVNSKVEESPVIKGGINEVIKKSNGQPNDQLYDAYFNHILTKTMTQYQKKHQTVAMLSPQNTQGTLRTGLQNIPTNSNPLMNPEILQNIASFKTKFLGLLKEAESSGQVITKERVQQFFMDLSNQRNHDEKQ